MSVILKMEKIKVLVNSTTVLRRLEAIARARKKAENISIEVLAALLDITVPTLVSLLTELEHRDEIIVNISSKGDTASAHGPEYTGTVRLMKDPPDEKGLTEQ
jgi:hypothetical protein